MQQELAVIQEKISAYIAEHPESVAEGGARLRALAGDMHPADLADLLETLPVSERLAMWRAMADAERGETLLEASDPVRDFLMEETPDESLAAALREMPGHEAADLLRGLPQDERLHLARLAGFADNEEMRASLAFADDSVGAFMDFEQVTARAGQNVGEVTAALRQRGSLPGHCDKLFITDHCDRLIGVLPLKRLLLNADDAHVRDIMVGEDIHTFSPVDGIDRAAGAFERYDLISAPVVDGRGKIVGRLTVDEVLDHSEERGAQSMLSSAGLAESEDLFAPLGKRFNNRWLWLAINLVGVFAISRVVGLFEDHIARLAALASLMPVVAGMSGNIGNQTATLAIRALALRQITAANRAEILTGELKLSLINGALWGGAVGAFAWMLYGSPGLSAVIVASMLACFAVAAAAGLFIPLFMQRIGKDPALGAGVALSITIDICAFFIFLGLAALFLFGG